MYCVLYNDIVYFILCLAIHYTHMHIHTQYTIYLQYSYIHYIGLDYIEIRQLFSGINQLIPSYQENPSALHNLTARDIISYMNATRCMSSEYVELQDFLIKLIPHIQNGGNGSGTNTSDSGSDSGSDGLNSAPTSNSNNNGNSGVSFNQVELLELLSVCRHLSSSQQIVLTFYDVICDRYFYSNTNTNTNTNTVLTTRTNSNKNINNNNKGITTQLVSSALLGLHDLSSEYRVTRRLLSILNAIMQHELETDELFNTLNPTEVTCILYGCKSLLLSTGKAM